jgi:putative spermidine/putrescine transport system substrate-binding protein
MRRREFLGLTAAAAASPFAPSLPAFGQAKPSQLVLMTWGGLWGDVQKKSIDTLFEKETGIRVVHESGASPVERITKLKVSLSSQAFDILNLHDGLMPLAVKQGVLEPFNRASPAYTNLKDIYPAMVYDHWAATLFSAIGVTYNRKLKNPPQSWADLWNPEYKGRIVLPDITHSMGPYIVPIGAQAQGKGTKDLETGYEALKRMADLKPILAKDTDSIMAAFQNEEALIGLLYKSQTFTVQGKGGNVDWAFPKEGGIEISWGYGICKGSKNAAWAERWINHALSPEGQLGVGREFNYPGSNRNMVGVAPPELQPRLRFTDEQLQRIVRLDHDFMAENRAAITERWNRIMSS